MARLSAAERAKLPDSSFAYIDSTGRRRLPLNDEAHVRNALARFDRVVFESEAARERARRRLLNAARRHGIVPVGFIDGQLRSERSRSADPSRLPQGKVAFLLSDIEGSTALLAQLGDRYARLLKDVRTIVRRAVGEAGGHEVDARADEFFGVFPQVAPALEAAVAIQRTMARRAWPGDVECRVRVGVHSGTPTVTDAGYIGLAVHVAARVCAVAHGGQVLVSGEARTALRGGLADGMRLRPLGRHRLSGIARPHAIYQLEAEGLLTGFPPPRNAEPVARGTVHSEVGSE